MLIFYRKSSDLRILLNCSTEYFFIRLQKTPIDESYLLSGFTNVLARPEIKKGEK